MLLWRGDAANAPTLATWGELLDAVYDNGFPRPDLTWDDVRHRFGNRTDTDDRKPPANLENWVTQSKPKPEGE